MSRTCPCCNDGGEVKEAPEAGYAMCMECGERGWWRDDDVEWWRNDPDSQWYVQDDALNHLDATPNKELRALVERMREDATPSDPPQTESIDHWADELEAVIDDE